MPSLPKAIAEFMATYNVDADEIWAVRPGTYAIKHKALERVAVEQKIEFDGSPLIIAIDMKEKMVALSVSARMNGRSEWSTGEAAPYNNKNGYPVAMAEKRARDRVVLKLLQAHGTLYSEDESDEFKKRDNPHVTRPEDIGPTTQYDEHGEPVDNIPHGDPSIERLSKSIARPDYAACTAEMRANKTPKELDRWGKANANRIASYPADWQEIMRGLYADHLNDLRAQNGKAA